MTKLNAILYKILIFISLVFVAGFLLNLNTLSASAEIEVNVIDNAGFFSKSEVDKYSDLLKKAGAASDIELIVLTVDKFEEDDIVLAAKNYAEENELGINNRFGAYILYICKDTNEIAVWATDKARDVFYASRRQKTIDKVIKAFNNEGAVGILRAFHEYCVEELEFNNSLWLKGNSSDFTKIVGFEKEELPYEDKLEYEKEIQSIEKSYQMDIMIWAVEEDVEDIDESAYNMSLLSWLGKYSDNGSCMLFINKKDNNFVLAPYGEKVRNIINYYAIEYINEQLKDDIDNKNYNAAIQKYIKFIKQFNAAAISSYGAFDYENPYKEMEFDTETTEDEAPLDNYAHVDDRVNYLSTTMKNKVEKSLSEFKRKYDIDIRLVTVDTYKEKNIDKAAVKYMEDNKMGDDSEYSGFIYYISKDPREFSLTARDAAQDIFYTDVREAIFAEIAVYMKIDDYDNAAEIFVLNCEKELEEHRNLLNQGIENPNNDTYVIGQEGIVLKADAEKMDQKLQEFNDKYDIDLVVSFVNSNSTNLEKMAMDALLTSGYGLDRKNGAVILFINNQTKEYVLMPKGKSARYIFNFYGLPFISDKLSNSISSRDYEKTINRLVRYSGVFIKKAEKDAPYGVKGRYMDLLGNIEISLTWVMIITPITLIFLIFKMRKEFRNLEFKYGVSDMHYMSEFYKTLSSDKFINQTVSIEKIASHSSDDSDSSGGSGYSSSSSSSGGSSYGSTSGGY